MMFRIENKIDKLIQIVSIYTIFVRRKIQIMIKIEIKFHHNFQSYCLYLNSCLG